MSKRTIDERGSLFDRLAEAARKGSDDSTGPAAGSPAGPTDHRPGSRSGRPQPAVA